MKPSISLAGKKCPYFPLVKTKEIKKEIKQKAESLIILKQTFLINQNFESSSRDKNHDERN